MPRTDRTAPLRTRGTALPALLLSATLLLSACAGGTTTSGSGPGEATAGATIELAVAPASFDVAVGPDRRLIVAVFTAARERIAGGAVRLRLAHLGDQPGGEAELGPPVTATWLPVPGLDVPDPEAGPAVVEGGVLTGVYAARVTLDRPGFWGVVVEADLRDGRRGQGRAVVSVLPAPAVIDVGEPAPTVPNVVAADVAAGRAPASALDSRLRDADAPDRAAALHTTRIPDALAAGRPLVVAIATPVYCQSLVCGPLTEHLVQLQARFGDRAEFVHVEVWEDFDAQVLSPTAAAWIQTETGGNEPWVFLVGSDGRIAARWDNVLDTTELEELLAGLPAT